MNGLDISSKRAALSPAKRALLEKYLRGGNPPGPSIQTIPRSGLTEAPLSFAQQRIWLLCQLDPHNPFYHMAYRVRLSGALDRAALEETLDEIVRRQEILRTVYLSSRENPVQKVLPSVHLPLPLVDISHLSAAERDDELLRLSFEEVRLPFDLAESGPLRVKLIILGHQEHVLLMTVHHIAFDGWSLGVLIREVASLYPALAQGEPPTLPVLPIQYADFAFWQRQELQGERLQGSLEYWMHKLDDLPVLQLPTDHPRPSKQSFRGANFSFALPSDLSQGLKELSLREGATVFSLCLAAFQILLQRYSGQSDIILGTVVANRDLPETSNLIGCLLNTLVIRSRVEVEAYFHRFLGQVHRDFLEVYEHRDLPFEKLVEELQPERDLGRNPLFQVAVVFHNAPIGALQLPELAVTAGEVELGITRFDLTLHLTETAEGLSGWLEYSTDLFLERTIARIVAHWRRLLESIVANPQARVSELTMLTEAEHRQLAVWNATDAEISLESRLHRLLEAQAARTPDAVAASHDGQTLSYGMLNQRANQLAHALQQRGVGPEMRVGVCLEPGLEMVVALLGILKAGGAYVPVDPSYPPQRQADILTNSGAVLVVTQQHYAAALAACGAEFFCLDQHPLVGWPEHNPVAACHPDNAAYLIYTSGSTGRPKGVAVSHRNAVHSTAARLDYYGEPVRGFLLLSSYAFDSSVAGIFWTLGQGGQLCIPSEADRRDPLALAQLIAKESISRLLCLPSLYGLLLEQAESGQLETLNTVIVAGEACPAPIVAAHYARLPSVRLYNEYGPTEGTVWSSVHAVQAEEGETGHSVPIGRPISNTQIHLLDAHFNQVPVGVAGELYIGGAGIARGYHGRPALTAERFVPDPFAKEAGNRLYKTGDIARYREEGEIEFLGRLDHQVKIRGYRIELGEIEALLLAHSDVKEAVVLAREDHPGDKRLVAYLVFRDGVEDHDPVLESVRADLRIVFPDYMVPSVFMFLESLPLMPNGKVDRKALPAPEKVTPIPDGKAMESSNPIEQMLVEMWAEVLGVKSIGIHDNFFDLGGHSLSAIQVIARLQESFDVELPVVSLFEAPTIEELAVLIMQQQSDHLDNPELASLLGEIEGLSDEEAAMLLNRPQS
ncbi:non-ribosomal peptide synthetase [Nitrosococcus oceani]|uniref:non-ribosomal peptide synthetase n=1 Tax=Nitrosococcus oceani TaxID=1229 RepID=UPI00068F9CFF|nr:non-ribosomal peptide synthetase [Nitrosococcus oceani]